MSDFNIHLDEVMAGLKDFQRRTVDHVFHRMYVNENPTRRFLVADEVGLGKTMVARGIIAKAIDHLRRKGTKQIDVLYICSNATIAQQNLNRLNVTVQETAAFATRLTLLPKQIGSLKKNGINFISFTPGTTFNLRSKGGRVDERALIYQMLRGKLDVNNAGLLNLLQGGIEKRANWHARAKAEDEHDEGLAKKYRQLLLADVPFIERLRDQCHACRDARMIGNDELAKCFDLIGELRSRLADACIDALEPDLVILDEFQRFKDLLHGDDDSSELAQQLFRHHEVRVLLLSATPYRMLSLDHEQEEDHYSDFLETLRFLYDGDDSKIEEIKFEFRRFREALYGINGETTGSAGRVRDRLQSMLSSVIARTERIGATHSQNAMIVEPQQFATMRSGDLQAARFVDRLAGAVDAGDTIEYWKSSPYLINFMADYDLKRKFRSQHKKPSAELHQVIRDANGELLRKIDVQKYLKIDPNNARLRQLLSQTVDAGQWRWLWMPPSLPYTKPGGAYANTAHATKSLIFSSWQVVPDAIAAISSFEAERAMMADASNRPRYSELHRKRRPLLQFRIDPETRKPSNMVAMALVYPCATLANILDPLVIAIEVGGDGPADVDAVKQHARAIVASKLAQLRVAEDRHDNRVDERWYWATPVLLDAAFAEEVAAWTTDPNGFRSALSSDDSDPAASTSQYIDSLIEMTEGRYQLGRRPDDLIEVLVELGLAAPGVCAIRAMRRVAAELPESSFSMLSAAARVANAMRSQFNQPETISLLRGDDEQLPYWRRVLHYCLDGNLQAVLDEYAHVLKESLGLAQRSGAEIAAGVADAMSEAMTLRTSSLRVDDIKATGKGSIRLKDFSIRCRFAMRFGDVRDDNNQKLVRAGSVRQAFNSPFKPFILASTSVGQEGLDFHPYCHVIYHWNLPSNPVDLEQREGRVNRYKGHAIRRNIAMKYGLAALRNGEWQDAWEHLFGAAKQDRDPSANDLIPYWLYEVVGGYAIERRVSMLPMSREVAQLKHLKRMLSVYRLAFGQPRQEDLLSYLSDLKQDETNEQTAMRICLAPPER